MGRTHQIAMLLGALALTAQAHAQQAAQTSGAALVAPSHSPVDSDGVDL